MKTGYVGIVGAPNVGKSTFINKVLNFKIAITSDKPQTTRHRILGVYNEEEVQIIFIDTPGLHSAKRELNFRMVSVANNVLKEVDVLLFVIEASKKGLKQGKKLVDNLQRVNKPVLVLLNKIDLLFDKGILLFYLKEIFSWGTWRACVPVSSKFGKGIDSVIKELTLLLPEADPLFSKETLTDMSERFLVGEIIREKVFRFTGQEVPYSSAVTVDRFLEPEGSSQIVAIDATIHVERKSQRGIIIGKGGKMIKKIGTKARLDIEKLLGNSVFLNLFVHLETNWPRNKKFIEKFCS